MATAALDLTVRNAYREELGSDGPFRDAEPHLEAASDALSMALLTLAGDDDDLGDRLGRAQQGRRILAEALTSLSRARIYLPAVRTHALPVLLANEPHPEAELQRLRNLASRLIWQNHAFLPTRLPAKPMAPEEEAQLARVLAGLARNARIDRALRYKWAGMSVALALLGGVLGLLLMGAIAAMGAVGLTLWQVSQDRRLSGVDT